MRHLLSLLATKLHAPVYRSRLKELVSYILPHLRADDRVLDVGCGNGTLAQALMKASGAPDRLRVEGLERAVRGGEPITVHAYDGKTIPFVDDAFDVVILADVLHHELNPEHLLEECARVCRRFLIIKDHQINGLFAHSRIKLLDWAANAPYGVPCVYRYNTPAQWTRVPTSLDMEVVQVVPSMRLYPFPYWVVFGGPLQYFTVLNKRSYTKS